MNLRPNSALKRYSNNDMHRLRDRVLALYKEKNFSGYDPELQMLICCLLTFVADYEARTGQQLDFMLEERETPTPIDDL